MSMNGRDEIEDAGLPEEVGPAETPPPAGPPRVERKRRKVSLIGAIVINVITVLTVAIILLAVLLPGYRRSFTMARAVEGAEEVWIVVRTSEVAMRERSTDFIKAQDGLRNAMQELVSPGSNNVWAYVRDNFPDQAWVQRNLPENMQQWLEELYPKPEEEEKPEEEQQDTETPANGNDQQAPTDEQPTGGTRP